LRMSKSSVPWSSSALEVVIICYTDVLGEHRDITWIVKWSSIVIKKELEYLLKFDNGTIAQ
jgi:hypothetical protein